MVFYFDRLQKPELFGARRNLRRQLSVGRLGEYSHKNAYFEVPADFVLSFPLQASIFYAGENWQVVLGIDVNWLISIPASGDVALKKTLPVRDQFGSKTIAAGRMIHVFSERDEMYWGPFVSFVYTF